MPRQTITLSEPNHSWIQEKVKSREFRSNSEAVNDALRRARELENGIEAIRARLIEAEHGGFSDNSPAQILKDLKTEAHKNEAL